MNLRSKKIRLPWPGFLLAFLPLWAHAQTTVVTDSSRPGYRTVIAGKAYGRSGLHRLFWGRDWRPEWTRPVTVPVLNLDTTFGGLTVLEAGGGRQTQSLRLRDAQGRIWMLRSVNKSYSGALPEIARGTVVESLVNDQVATLHPYAPLAIPSMAAAAGVYHTNPVYFFIPAHPRLGAYNAAFANTLALLEERPDESQASRSAFGQPEDIIGTDKLLRKVGEENDHLVDQGAYVKTRLFDMLVGDWGRHEDNWRWSRFDTGVFKVYRPVPKDRDQVWSKFDGILLKALKSGAGLKQLQSFDDKIGNVQWYNFPAIDLDRRFTNALTHQVWTDSAKALQSYLTDAVLENAIRQMPAEIRAISGKEILRNLKRRRDKLLRYVNDYYGSLAKAVDVPGSRQRERFEVERREDGTTRVRVFRFNGNDELQPEPVFDRTFFTSETDEVRLFGLGGEDQFHIRGDAGKGILVRVIGGPDRDAFIDSSSVAGRRRMTRYYDNPGNTVITAPETRTYISTDTLINRYDYEGYRIDKRGWGVAPGYNNPYRFYIGVRHKALIHGFRKEPLKRETKYGLNFSVVETSFSPYLTSTWYERVGRWNLNLALGYDGVRRVNYYGVGNNTRQLTEEREFHRLRTQNLYTAVGLERAAGTHSTIDISLNWNGVKVIDRRGNFVSKGSGQVALDDFRWKHFLGPQFQWTFLKVNDPLSPSRGIHFSTRAEYTMNLQEMSRRFANLSANVAVYIPLVRNLSLALKTGGATLSGDAEFYQLNTLGGNYTVRGYPRWRFYGKEIFFNQNELRWVKPVRMRLFNGRIGLVGLFDQGRVWMAGEDSDRWHLGYGGGIILIPFNKITAAVTVSRSREDRLINFRFGRFL